MAPNRSATPIMAASTRAAARAMLAASDPSPVMRARRPTKTSGINAHQAMPLRTTAASIPSRWSTKKDNVSVAGTPVPGKLISEPTGTLRA
jgi:hypothetical protein